MSKTNLPINWFRTASPYISGHREKTFVIYLPGHVIAETHLGNIVQDICLVSSLGARVVLVHGAATQIEDALSIGNQQSQFSEGIRITTPAILPFVQFGISQAKSALESEFSKSDAQLAFGNHLKAKPLGIEAGIDFHNTGRVRKVNTKAIRQQLDHGSIVMISPLGYSPSGEAFNINSLEVAGEVATALIADKLIIIDQDARDAHHQLINEIQVGDIDTSTLDHHDPLSIARMASINGVNRCHLLDHRIDGALLSELFTRDGVGTQVVRKSYEQVRSASAKDVAGIIELLEPLEAQGILVKRSRELLESEIDKFVVIDRDSTIVACAALYDYGEAAELACLVTHPNYRDGTRGELLLANIIDKAKTLSYQRLFVLTTHTAHWFIEHGFKEVALEDLPVERQSLYNYQRNSKLLMTQI